MNRSIRNKTFAVLAAAALTAGAAACSSDDDAADDTTETTEAEDTTETTEAEEAEDGEDEGEEAEEGDETIVDLAVAAGDFTTLVALLTEADLVDTLSGDGPFTVFAPTDAAFDAVDADLLATVGDDIDLLTTVLTYHVISGEVLAADVVELDGESVETLAGETLLVSVDGTTVTLTDGAGQTITVTDVDVVGSNGVIHIVDTVMLPVDPSTL